MIRESQINSLQHPLVKHLVKLRHNRDYREEHALIVIDGIKMVTEVGRSHPPLYLLVRDSTLAPLGVVPNEQIIVTDEIMEKIAGTLSPEGIVAVVAMPAPGNLEKKKRILALDGVNDPGNIGTLLRTALAFGWEGVFLFHDCCDPYNDKALRAAKGATFRLPIQMGSWEDLKALVQREQLPLYGADLNGKPVDETAIPSSLVLILGSEAHGLSEPVRQVCQRVTLPHRGEIDSLNVAVAGGILMYVLSQ